MGRLIDADELERYIDNCDFCDRCPDASPRCQIDCEMPDFLTKRWKRVIDAQPTVDAEPIRHGKWIQREFKSIWNNKLIVCSECGELFLVQHVESEHYCRNCGAKMDEEKKKK